MGVIEEVIGMFNELFELYLEFLLVILGWVVLVVWFG